MLIVDRPMSSKCGARSYRSTGLPSHCAQFGACHGELHHYHEDRSSVKYFCEMAFSISQDHARLLEIAWNCPTQNNSNKTCSQKRLPWAWRSASSCIYVDLPTRLWSLHSEKSYRIIETAQFAQTSECQGCVWCSEYSLLCEKLGWIKHYIWIWPNFLLAELLQKKIMRASPTFVQNALGKLPRKPSDSIIWTAHSECCMNLVWQECMSMLINVLSWHWTNTVTSGTVKHAIARNMVDYQS